MNIHICIYIYNIYDIDYVCGNQWSVDTCGFIKATVGWQ